MPDALLSFAEHAMDAMSSLPPLVTDPTIDALIAAQAPIGFSVSGGKDSGAVALATSAYLDAKGHQGERIVLHADLGAVEWATSQAQAQRLADRLGLELVVVRRKAGGLLERWQQRWADNVARYAALQTVCLVMPWSAAGRLRYCTSELKSAPLSAYLAKRYPGQTIISVVGIRAEESASRAKAPVWQAEPRLTRVRAGTSGVVWHPILHWKLADVLGYHEMTRFPLHEAYAQGSSRVSCCYCVLASQADLLVASRDPQNHAVYRALVDLESAACFPFQPKRWLGMLAQHLLTQEQREAVHQAQGTAQIRARLEAQIPRHLLYTAGWPQVMPTPAEARLLAEVRSGVAAAQGFAVGYTTADAILERYAELMRERAEREARGGDRHARSA